MINKILFGDDREEVRISIARELKLRKLEVDLASTPSEMITKAKEYPYSAIVTDLEYTPDGREGYEVIKAIKDLPAVKIVYTGLNGFEYVAEGILTGADHVVLGKRQSELLGILEKLKGGNEK